jgi:sulfhydrogenase subunit beta (sulfur reductase)
MTDYFLKESGLSEFVRKLMATKPVIGPVAKKRLFMFAELEAPEELRLDYDVSMLPPKKAIFPVRQNLVEFEKDGYQSSIRPREQVLLGVHFYDIKAIDMLDLFFREGHADNNYLANREATTIVGSSIQRVSHRAFFGTVGKSVPARGHDAFLTKIQGGYVFQTLTAKGEALVRYGEFAQASSAQVAEARKENEAVLGKCPEQLSRGSEEIAQKVRQAFKKEELWESLAQDCFSCGKCNIVCPTCYCFDVQDKWNLDQVSGVRYRSWDGCQLEDFAKVSLGAGAQENFREKRSQRYRHRLMRKTSYSNEKLGGPACVGCGRCSLACVPDIADPVKIINRILEEK